MWVIFGAFAAFASMQYHSYLLEVKHHFKSTQIGNALLLANLQYLVGPFWVAYLCKNVFSPTRVLALNLLILAISLIGLPFASNLGAATFLLSLNVLASNSCFILVTSLMLFSAGPYGASNYLLLRSIGTLGFASVCLFSFLINKHINLSALYMCYGAIALFTSVKCFKLIEMIPPETKSIRYTLVLKALLKKPMLGLWICLIITNLVSWVGSYFVGSFLHNEFNSPSQDVAKAWSIATFSEIPLIWLSIVVLKKFSLKSLLFFGMFVTAIRMGITAMATEPYHVYIAQIFHGFFYGSTLSAFSLYLKRCYNDRWTNSLNLVSSLGIMGLGTTIGAQLTGTLWNSFGLRSAYGAGAVLALAAGLWTLFFFKEDKANV